MTLQGWVGGDVTLRAGRRERRWRPSGWRAPRGATATSGEWVDGPTQWYTVNAWRALAEHCAASLRARRPGRRARPADADVWSSATASRVTSCEVEATFVGHDLNRGTSDVQPSPARPAPAAGDGAEAVAADAAAAGARPVPAA